MDEWIEIPREQFIGIAATIEEESSTEYKVIQVDGKAIYYKKIVS